jgi:hypothetical protein
MSMTASTGSSYETEASTYFAAIVTAGSSITESNKLAVDAFIKGCKSDGIWTAIKASCLLAGPDSLAGALVPLVGVAPTNNGPFVSGDYSRTTGLVGNGGGKYLNSNRNNTADPQDSRHLSVFASTITSINPSAYIGVLGGGASASQILRSATASTLYGRLSSGAAQLDNAHAAGFLGVNRTDSSNIRFRGNGITGLVAAASATPDNGNLFVFARNSGGLSIPSNGRISFYSLGESIDLALLDARLTTYMAALT